MATASRLREADQVSAAFQQAMNRIGVQIAVETLTLWQDVPAQPGVPGWARWLPRIVQLVLLRRRQAREMAEAYYRLQRALLTGTTVIRAEETPGQYTTLDGLRYEFNSIIGFNYGEAADDGSNPNVLLEDVPELDAEADEAEASAKEAVETTLDHLSRAALEGKLDSAPTQTDDPSQVDGIRQEGHRVVGLRTASAMARHAMNGARSSIYARTTRDPRTIGYVRMSRTGTPCGFCAMLISREVFYKTEASAVFSADTELLSYIDGDRYHDNCMCQAVPVYSQDDYDKSDLFALNREYREAWPQVTEGLSGAAARRAWRRYIESNR